jgi:hypothetical protein
MAAESGVSMGILARLGHVIFLLGLLLAVLIVLGALCIIAFQLWNDASDLWTLMESGRGPIVLDWLIKRTIYLVIAVVVALIPLVIGAACCYVLGGFSSQSK